MPEVKHRRANWFSTRKMNHQLYPRCVADWIYAVVPLILYDSVVIKQLAFACLTRCVYFVRYVDNFDVQFVFLPCCHCCWNSYIQSRPRVVPNFVGSLLISYRCWLHPTLASRATFCQGKSARKHRGRHDYAKTSGKQSWYPGTKGLMWRTSIFYEEHQQQTWVLSTSVVNPRQWLQWLQPPIDDGFNQSVSFFGCFFLKLSSPSGIEKLKRSCWLAMVEGHHYSIIIANHCQSSLYSHW